MNELKELCKPLQDYLLKNHNIHTEIVVEIDRITVKQDIEGIPTDEHDSGSTINNDSPIIFNTVDCAKEIIQVIEKHGITVAFLDEVLNNTRTGILSSTVIRTEKELL